MATASDGARRPCTGGAFLNGPQSGAGRGKPASLSEVSDSGRNLQPEIRVHFRWFTVCWDSQGYSRKDVGSLRSLRTYGL